MSDSKVTEVIISTLTSLERAAASYWFGPSPPVWFSRRPNSGVYISPKPFPAFPIFTSATLVHAVAQPRNFGKLLLTHPSSSPAPIRLPSPPDWHVTHHQILLNVPLKYVSVPHTCLHPPVTDMVPVTIPPPSNSSSQSLDSWPESKEQESGPQARTLALVFGVSVKSTSICSCPGRGAICKSFLTIPNSTLHDPQLLSHIVTLTFPFTKTYSWGFVISNLKPR